MAITRRGFFGVIAAAVVAPQIASAEPPAPAFSGTVDDDPDQEWGPMFGVGMIGTVCGVCGGFIDLTDRDGNGSYADVSWVAHPESGICSIAHPYCVKN